ncbi:hypothetical protein C7B67_06400 [filamentous cyanobacterium Phorm 6]|nr:hypothetical protein C7B67_06400 [filamentous cyanobacterium Phorm 6]
MYLQRALWCFHSFLVFKKSVCFDVATVTQNFQQSVRSLNSASAPTLSTLPLPALSMPSPCPLFALTLRLFALDPLKKTPTG